MHVKNPEISAIKMSGFGISASLEMAVQGGESPREDEVLEELGSVGEATLQEEMHACTSL